MSTEMIYEQALNGVPVTLADLPKLATLNAGHFTAMQVREDVPRGSSCFRYPAGRIHADTWEEL